MVYIPPVEEVNNFFDNIQIQFMNEALVEEFNALHEFVRELVDDPNIHPNARVEMVAPPGGPPVLIVFYDFVQLNEPN